jgi:hypothetical protein
MKSFEGIEAFEAIEGIEAIEALSSGRYGTIGGLNTGRSRGIMFIMPFHLPPANESL